MSLYDFYMYLKYIEFSAENLEFYIWYVTTPQGIDAQHVPYIHFRYKNYETAYMKLGSEKDDNSVRSAPSSTGSEAKLADSTEKLPNIDVSEFAVDPELGKSPACLPQATCRHRPQLTQLQPRTLLTGSPN